MKKIVTLVKALKTILYEKVKGIDVIRGVEEKKLGIPLNIEPHHYSSSGNKHLKKVLAALEISKKDSIIDIGCGKGGALITMSKFPFKEIRGIELSDHLYNIAKKNIDSLNLKNVSLENCNAASYKDYSKFNYIYFYNPFGEIIMREVLSNLCDSINMNQNRKVIIIYKNPEFHNLIIETRLFKKTSEFPSETNHKFFIYSTN